MLKFRWSRVYESSEEELVSLLNARNLQSEHVALEAGSDQLERKANTTTVVWCAEGSLTVSVQSDTVSLQPGDATRIADGASYILKPGIAGFICYITS